MENSRSTARMGPEASSAALNCFPEIRCQAVCRFKSFQSVVRNLNVKEVFISTLSKLDSTHA